MMQTIRGTMLGIALVGRMLAQAEPQSARYTREIERVPWEFPTESPGAATSLQDYCLKTRNAAFAQNLLTRPENWLAFANAGGLFNGGVCWWHSQFTRHAAYLAFFSPLRPAPTLAEARQIISLLRKGDRVVEIPGFPNLRSFSRKFQNEIQSELESWQRWDGFVRHRWLRGISGATEQTPHRMKGDMDALFSEVHQKKKVVYQMLQIPGIDSHAWLVIQMEKTLTGYKLLVVDSNAPDSALTMNYAVGQRSFQYGSTHLYPYTDNDSALRVIAKAVAKVCR